MDQNHGGNYVSDMLKMKQFSPMTWHIYHYWSLGIALNTMICQGMS